ncbi:MAG TPA: hypothetical protein DCZ94_04555 [Lentisphaeria bacterium]|nr:MAG: hypothetical protein A2X48_20215 [Lentisphaerae bacterium GWF2_49_21]HBC86206.1 hypothetical protein [Lentisphaeria bacterium]
MCLAVPMKLTKVASDKLSGSAEFDGIERDVNLSLIEKPRVGDYVIIHAGFAIEKFNAKEAKIQLELFREITEAVGLKKNMI